MLWLLSNKLLGGAFTQNILLILCDLIAAIQHFIFSFSSIPLQLVAVLAYLKTNSLAFQFF